MKLKQFTRFLLIKLLILSLVYSPVSFGVVEQNQWALTGQNIVGQTMNTWAQFQQLQNNTMMRNSLTNALQIKPRNEPLFGCPMAEAISQFPEGYCQAPLDPADVSLSNWVGDQAASRLDYYDQLLSEVQIPVVGIQCMVQGSKMQQDSFKMKINQLQAFIAKIKEEDEQFKRMLTEKKKGMQQLYGEINGQSKGTGSLSEDTNNYVEAFKKVPGCTSVMTTAKLGATGRSTGLKGIRGFMMAPGKGGMSVVDRTYAINDGTIKRDIDKQISNLRKKIQEDGLAGFSGSNYRGNGNAYKGMERILAEQNNEIEKKKNELQSLLQDVDPSMKVPPLNKYFAERISTMEKEAGQSFKDGIIESCINDPSYAGISMQDLLKGIKKKEGGSTLKTYKRLLQDKLNDSSLSIDEKLNQIDALSAKYSSSGIYVKSGNGKYRPQELIRKLVKTCDNMYEEGTLKGGNKDTFKRKVEMTTQAVSELKAWESSFIGNLEQEIRDGIVNCTDSKTDSVGGCSAGNLNPSTNDSFCLKSAKTCSTKINSCLANIDNMIKDRTTNLNAAADSYNVLIQQHINKRKQQLANTAQYTFLQADWLSNFFKGSKIKVPVIGIETPEKTLDTKLKLDLLSGGNMKFLDAKSGSSLISQLNKLEKTLDKQQDNIKKQIAEKIGAEKANLIAEKAKWQKIKDDCDSSVASFDQMQQQMYTQEMQQQQESLAKADAFCRKYNRLRETGPGPGCDDEVEDLAEDMDQIATMLNPSVNSNLGQMKAICNSVNNEQSDLEADDSMGDLDALCESLSDQDAILEKVQANVALTVPEIDLSNFERSDFNELDEDALTSAQRSALSSYLTLKDKIKGLNANAGADLAKELKTLRDTLHNSNPTKYESTIRAIEVQITKVKETSEDDICSTLQARYRTDAVLNTCNGETCTVSAIEKEIISLQEDKSKPSGFQKAIGSKAKGLLTIAAAPSWSAFGEEPEGTCYSQAAGNRIGENALVNPFSTIPGMENMGNIMNN